MIRYTGTVIYRSGERVEFEGGPREWVAWEAYALGHHLPTASAEPGQAAGLTMTWYLAYLAATRDQPGRPGYLPWLDLLADVSDFKVLDVDPTQPEPSTEASSSSPWPLVSIPNGSDPGPPRTSQLSRTS